MSTRPRYDDLTLEQRRRLCNGCGRKGGLVPVPQFIFRGDCNRHDFDYWIGGGVFARFKADVAFLARMMLRACEVSEGWRQMIRWLGTSLLYFIAVRRFGWAAFHYGAPRTTADLPKRPAVGASP